MSTAAAKKFAMKALQLFPPFRWDDEQEDDWIQDVMKEISHFDDDVIDRGERDMVQTRKRKDGTPAVSDCIRYCAEAFRWMQTKANKDKLLPSATPEPFLADWRLDDFANDIALNRQDPLCVRAAKENWIGVLHSFVRKHRRMPSATEKIGYRKSMKAAELLLPEIEWCKREAKDFDEAYAVAVRGTGSVARSLVLGCGDAMLKRRSELIDYVLHGVEFRKNGPTP